MSLLPRDLWRNRSFSEALAWFSLPMVWATDQRLGVAGDGPTVLWVARLSLRVPVFGWF